MLKHKLKKTTEKMYFGRKSGEKKKSNSKVTLDTFPYFALRQLLNYQPPPKKKPPQK